MGTNILKFSFDFYLQGLSGRYIGFYIKGTTTGEDGSEQDADIASFYANYYDNAINSNTFGIDQGNLKYASGSNYNNVAPQGAEDAGTYVCSKNSFEVILDFGEKSMYCVTTSDKGTVMTDKAEFDGTIPTSFVLQSNYSNDARRCWFDNLKIERIAAGEADAIQNVKAAAADGAIYNLSGQRLNAAPAKGLYIQNGKKFMVK